MASFSGSWPSGCAVMCEEPFQVDGVGGPITVSVGVAGFPCHGTTEDALIGAADAAMYAAKRAGRNRVHVAGVQPLA